MHCFETRAGCSCSDLDWYHTNQTHWCTFHWTVWVVCSLIYFDSDTSVTLQCFFDLPALPSSLAANIPSTLGMQRRRARPMSLSSWETPPARSRPNKKVGGTKSLFLAHDIECWKRKSFLYLHLDSNPILFVTLFVHNRCRVTVKCLLMGPFTTMQRER